MKLFYSNTSPYARKVRITLIEKGVIDQTELVVVSPQDNPAALIAVNPLCKIPTLVTAEGKAVYDSRVICRYLDALVPEPALVPQGDAGIATLTAEALCEGMMDALFALVMERRRNAVQQSAFRRDRWQHAFLRACDQAEADLAAYVGDLSAAQIALGVALGYADYRTPDLDWRAGRPQLAAWYRDFAVRPSFAETAPPEA